MSSNICATFYDGDFDVSFECSNENQKKCKCFLNSGLASAEDEPCCFEQCCACMQKGAQIAAIKKLVARLNKRRLEIEQEARE